MESDRQIQDERPNGVVSSSSYYKLLTDPQNKFRVVGGASGVEGYWGQLVVGENNNSWTAYELNLTPLADAIFLSDYEVVASGVQMRGADDKLTEPAVGIVLRSIDGGKSWSPIYRSRRKESFIKLIKVRDRQFYAISDSGWFVLLSLNQPVVDPLNLKRTENKNKAT